MVNIVKKLKNFIFLLKIKKLLKSSDTTYSYGMLHVYKITTCILKKYQYDFKNLSC